MNDMDPCPWSATPPAPTRWDTRAASDPPFSRPAGEPSRSRGPPEAPAAFGLELGNLTTVPGPARSPAPGLHLGVPQLTAVDPSECGHLIWPRVGLLSA